MMEATRQSWIWAYRVSLCRGDGSVVLTHSTCLLLDSCFLRLCRPRPTTTMWMILSPPTDRPRLRSRWGWNNSKSTRCRLCQISALEDPSSQSEIDKFSLKWNKTENFHLNTSTNIKTLLIRHNRVDDDTTTKPAACTEGCVFLVSPFAPNTHEESLLCVAIRHYQSRQCNNAEHWTAEKELRNYEIFEWKHIAHSELMR